MEKLSKSEKHIIDHLLWAGITKEEIADAMCDGEYLKEEGITQTESENILEYCENEKIGD